MEKASPYVELKVNGSVGNARLSPGNYDIAHLKNVLNRVEQMLFPYSKKDRPIISLEILEGSVRHLFHTSEQTVTEVEAVLERIDRQQYEVSFLDAPVLKPLEEFLGDAMKNDFSFELSTSINRSKITINKNTVFSYQPDNWVDAEFYFYGQITDAGGKNKANVHLDTDSHGLIKIDVDKSYLSGIESNLLYKTFGVRARGKQNQKTGDIDLSKLYLLEMSEYDSKPKDDYLDSLIEQATQTWKDVGDADEWLKTIRTHAE